MRENKIKMHLTTGMLAALFRVRAEALHYKGCRYNNTPGYEGTPTEHAFDAIADEYRDFAKVLDGYVENHGYINAEAGELKKRGL